VSDYGLDDRAIEVRSSAAARDFFSGLCAQTIGTIGTGRKAWQGRDAEHSPPSSAEVVNE
jgi:hypothetical protein